MLGIWALGYQFRLGFLFNLWIRLWIVYVLGCVVDLCVGFGELLCFGVVLWTIVWIVGGALCVVGLEGLIYEAG